MERKYVYELIEKVMNENEDLDLKFRFNTRSGFCAVILYHT